MGVDCSNCKCTNREDENILVIENSEKYFKSKMEVRRDKIEKIEYKQKVIFNKNALLKVKQLLTFRKLMEIQLYLEMSLKFNQC